MNLTSRVSYSSNQMLVQVPKVTGNKVKNNIFELDIFCKNVVEIRLVNDIVSFEIMNDVDHYLSLKFFFIDDKLTTYRRRLRFFLPLFCRSPTHFIKFCRQSTFYIKRFDIKLSLFDMKNKDTTLIGTIADLIS